MIWKTVDDILQTAGNDWIEVEVFFLYREHKSNQMRRHATKKTSYWYSSIRSHLYLGMSDFAKWSPTGNPTTARSSALAQRPSGLRSCPRSCGHINLDVPGAR